jgi:hypothetical protein
LLEAIEEAGVETTLLDFPLDEAPEVTDEALDGPDTGAECDLETDADEMEGTVVGGLEDTTTLGEARTLDGGEGIEEPTLLCEDFGPDVIAGEDALNGVSTFAVGEDTWASRPGSRRLGTRRGN